MRCGLAAPKGPALFFWPGPAVGWTAWLEPGGAERVGTAPSTRVFACNKRFYLGPALFEPDLRVLRVAWLEPGGAERVGAAPGSLDGTCKRRREVVATFFTGPSIVCSPTCRLQVAWLELGVCGEGGHRTQHAPLRATTKRSCIRKGPAILLARFCALRGRVAGAGGVR